MTSVPWPSSHTSTEPRQKISQSGAKPNCAAQMIVSGTSGIAMPMATPSTASKAAKSTVSRRVIVCDPTRGPARAPRMPRADRGTTPIQQNRTVPSVYERVLGETARAARSACCAGTSASPPGAVGRGAGVYEIAGSRHRWLRPVLAWMAWRRVLFPEFGRDIPFTIVNTTHADGTLSARREFAFPRVTRVMEDTMSVVDGALHDRLGRRGGLEVEFALEVVDGGLRMRSRRQWLHLGPAGSGCRGWSA